MTQDFLITDQAGVWLFEPLSESARKFLHRYMNFEEWPLIGESLAVDYRGAGALAEDLEDEGFTLAMQR